MSSGADQGRFHEEPGIWAAMTGTVSPKTRPALFLDRDGVIVEDPGYLSRVADMIVLPGAAEIIRLANRANWAVRALSSMPRSLARIIAMASRPGTTRRTRRANLDPECSLPPGNS